MTGHRTFGAVAVIAALVLAACSGVPTNSKPRAIGQVTGGVAPSIAPIVTPAPGFDERQIVLGFLDANVSEDSHHAGARNFLTADAGKKWVDSTASIVTDVLTGVANPQTHAVSVTADKVGTLDAHGIYTPVTNAGGSIPINLTFGLALVHGQWRISTVAPGLLVSEDEFEQTYRPRPVYFFDQSQRHVLSDLRYSALLGQTLCSWLLDQLIAGPRPELQSAYTTDLPEQATHASVVSGATITIDLPGASQLDPQTRVRLAAQLAYTFQLDFSASLLNLVDGSKPVQIPQVPSPFGIGSVANVAPSSPSPAVYYVRDGDVYRGAGGRENGPAGSLGTLDSIAVAQRGGGLLLAATRGKPEQAELVTGSLTGALSPSGLAPGPLTRPAWAVGLSEVWIGDGSKLMRLPSPGAAAVSVPLTTASGAVAGQIRSVAFSPDGVRIALIIKGTDGSSQVWIGTIVRTANVVSVDSLEPITPLGLKMTDVAWNDTSTLYVIGSDQSLPGGYGFWSVVADGSLFTPRPTAGLPSAPESITASPSGLPWVSANTAVWEQRGGSWTSPEGPITTFGTYPTYVQ